MGISREKVRDGYLKDLPEPVQKKVFEINKLIVNTVNELLDDKHYQDIKSSRWAMSCIDEFCQKPAGKSECGSVRVYQKGKKYRCMVQITGHFTNHQYGWIEELLHEIIAHTFQNIRPTIRKKYDITIENEGARGAVHEGFDIILPSKESQQIWELLDDRKTKSITESGLLIDDQTGKIIFERSHGDLKSSFRIAVNPDNGHYIRIIFDLDPKTVHQMGNHTNSYRNEEMIKNIRKTGHTNFSSRGKVIAIVDLDTGKRLNSVKTIGVIGSNYNTTRFSVPEEFYDKSLSEDEIDTFSAYPVKTRERIAASLKLDPKDAITYTVGELEPKRSYKSTVASKSINGLFDNQWGKGRGVISTQIYKSRINSDMNIRSAVSNLEKRLNRVETALNDDHKDDIASMKRRIKKLKDRVELNKDEKFGQSTMDARYHEDYVSAENYLLNLEKEVKKLNNVKNESYSEFDEYMMDDLPYGLQQTIKDLNAEITESVRKVLHSMMPDEQITGRSNHYSMNDILRYMNGNWSIACIGESAIYLDTGDIITGGLIDITPNNIEGLFSESVRDNEYIKLIDPITRAINKSFPKIKKVFESANPGKQLIFTTDDSGMNPRILMKFDNEYGYKLSNYINNHRYQPLTESSDSTPEYNVDMSEANAIKTLETLCASMMNGSNKKGITQYNANIFANIITKNLLQKWAKGFNKLSITVKPQQKNALEFVTPTMSQDFVARFIDGRELISGLLHREPEIKINISPRIFDTMKDASDGWRFFKAGVQYYDTGLEKASIDLFAEVKKLDHGMRHLISTTKLSGIVTCPMKLLFIFDDIDMHSKDPFKIDQEDIKAVCRFIKGITSNYASPENEQKEIIDAVESLVKSLQESCEMDDDIRSMTFLSEAVAQLYKGSFNDEIIKSDERFISEQVDYESMRKPRDPNVRYLQEKFGVKKLKKLPVDLVAYITIETESIRDANDKMMIASYCLGKIEIVEWYIELIDVGSKKYVVPHTKPYLDSVRTQLLACYKKIMETPIPKAPGNRPIIDIQYPKGYEG